MTGRLHHVITALALSFALAWGGCATEEGKPANLLLEISSDAPASGAPLDKLRLLFHGDGVNYPVDRDDQGFNIPLGTLLNPVAEPINISVAAGTDTFSAPTVTVQVTGLIGEQVATIFVGTVDLSKREVIKVHLNAVADNCDADHDGFVDCELPGCCAEGADIFADCEPDAAEANPWGVEDECEPCADELDQDCDGEDVPCVDADNDGIEDCFDCDPTDGTVGQGLPEICDLKDNNCDGVTDERFFITERDQTLKPGEPCGLGLCAGGTVTCVDINTAACSTSDKAVEEICGNVDDNGDLIDDDCDGVPDDGCEAGDRDGDGFTAADGDCNDFDSAFYPNAPERCCPATLQGGDTTSCDTNCDTEVTFCDPEDLDGDGYTAAGGDCDDDDPLVHPGAPEKCGDGIDQDCLLGDVSCDDFVDGDGDGWQAPTDCNDADANINPEGVEVCDGVDNDCNGHIDDGNPDTDNSADCGTNEGECEFGTRVCVNGGATSGEVLCVDFKGPEPDLCDDLDNDCDGATDEDFPTYDDLDGTTGLVKGNACGVGACDGGVVQCNGAKTGLTCTTVGLATADVCDGLDNDCDGVADQNFKAAADGGNQQVEFTDLNGDDELFLGGDCGVGACGGGKVVCADLVSLMCDKHSSAGAEICDGQDNDCDGGIDEDYTNGSVTIANLDGTGALVKGQACGGGECGTGVVECAPDGTIRCSVASAATVEICDNADNDCDGQTDEDYGSGGTFKLTDFNGTAGLVKDAPCGVGACDPAGTATVQCDLQTGGLVCADSSGDAVTPTAEICDGIDNDCDGLVDEDFKRASGQTGGLGQVSFTDYDDAETTRFLGEDCGREGVCAAAAPTVQCHPSGARLMCANSDKAEVLPTPEVCDNADNDCDGFVDEDFKADVGSEAGLGLVDFEDFEGSTRFLGDTCGREGICMSAQGGGTVQCNVNSGKSFCAGTCPGGGCTAADAIKPKLEVCDNADNDCDGVVDEDFKLASDDGLETTAYQDFTGSGFADKFLTESCGMGECGGGTVICNPASGQPICSASSTTVDPIMPGPEICDGKDNDCDGEVDEDFKAGGRADNALVSFTDYDAAGSTLFLGDACGGEGECAASNGLVKCHAATGGVFCAASSCSGGVCPGSAEVQRASDICDGKDNDCDGVVDEAFKHGDDGGEAMVSFADLNGDTGIFLGQGCGTGDCQGGTVVCAGDVALACDRHNLVSAELCDGDDNDCDGDVDEGLTGIRDAAITGCNTDGACGLTGTFGDCAPTTSGRTNLNYVCTYGNALFNDGDEVGHCDGVDNDCDGDTDEDFVDYDFPHTTGEPVGQIGDACGAGACGGGTVVCNAGGTALTCSTDAPTSEVCDGIDNDCDGLIDEDFKAAADSGLEDVSRADLNGDTVYLGQDCGVGACGGGKVVCDPGDSALRTLQCSTHVNADTEICDGIDNDCDGGVDERYKAAADGGTEQFSFTDRDGSTVAFLGQGCGFGACDNGSVVCATPTTLGCDSHINVAAETCDGIDNDCDDGTDEDTGVAAGNDVALQAAGCKTAGLCDGVVEAVCVSGKYECTYGGVTGYIDEEVGVAACDGDDNDCDGLVDENIAGTTTAYLDAASCVSDGVCGVAGKTVASCSNGSWSCSYDHPAFEGLAPGTNETLCDDLDNDCDGAVDEAIVVNPGSATEATAIGCSIAGVCGDDAGSIEATCKVGTTAGWDCDYTNVDNYDPVEEGVNAAAAARCDNKDNDCDGQVDEGIIVDNGADNTLITAAGCDVDGVCGAASSTTATCSGGNWSCSYNHPAFEGRGTGANETRCDDLDNDCDNSVDENIVVNPANASEASGMGCAAVGACGADISAIAATCNAGTTPGWSCDYDSVSGYIAIEEGGAESLCDGVDNDCDGQVDESLVVASPTLVGHGCKVVGVCSGNVQARCTNGAAGSSASEWTCDYLSPIYVATEEGSDAAAALRCDDADNDCDGSTDEAITRTGMTTGEASARGCMTGGVCGVGVGSISATCNTGGSSGWACDYGAVTDYLATEEGEPSSAAEMGKACDNKDNDCDGAIDEGITVDNDSDNTLVTAAGCDTDGLCGVTGQTQATCQAGATSGWSCAYNHVDYEAGVETRCDNVDNNCDTFVDGNAAPNDITRTGSATALSEAGCATVGVCADTSGTTATCDDGAQAVFADRWSCAYAQADYVQTEGDGECDEKDNDCDGDTDEDQTAYDFPSSNQSGLAKGADCGPGICAGGKVICGGGGLTCTTEFVQQPTDASCDNIDQDCSGDADEDFISATRADANSDSCETRVQVCTAGNEVNPGDGTEDAAVDCSGGGCGTATDVAVVDLCIGCTVDGDCDNSAGGYTCLANDMTTPDERLCAADCSTDAECVSLHGDGWGCDPQGHCAYACTTNADCQQWTGAAVPTFVCGAQGDCQIAPKAPLAFCTEGMESGSCPDANPVCGVNFTGGLGCSGGGLGNCRDAGSQGYRVDDSEDVTIDFPGRVLSLRVFFSYQELTGSATMTFYNKTGGVVDTLAANGDCADSGPLTAQNIVFSEPVVWATVHVADNEPGAEFAWIDSLTVNGGAYAFVTSDVFTPGTNYDGTWSKDGSDTFNDLADADQICADVATAAGLDGTYAAWMSDGSNDAKDRVTSTPGVNFTRPDGTLVGVDIDTIIANESVLAAIKVDENGVDVGNTDVWTGTKKDGTKDDEHCSDWGAGSGDGRRGKSDETNDDWTDRADEQCSGALRLYCLPTSP